MLFAGALLIAMSDLLQRQGDASYETVKGAGWLITLASVFVLKPRGWRIPAYLVIAPLIVGQVAFSLYPVAGVALNPGSLSSECWGWNAYTEALSPIIQSENARNTGLWSGDDIPAWEIREAIQAAEANVVALEALDPPGAMADFHTRTIQLERDWISYYDAMITGVPSGLTLFSMHDDWVVIDHLRNEGNATCAAI